MGLLGSLEASLVFEESDGLQWKGTTLPTQKPSTGHYASHQQNVAEVWELISMACPDLFWG